MTSEPPLSTLLRAFVAARATHPLPTLSRAHRLRSGPTPDVWVKRDDELGFGTTGSKTRKYTSLIPALQERGVTDVVLEGGSRSNNVVVGCQLLRQAGLKPHLALRGRADGPGNGNRLLVELLAAPDEIRWLGKVDAPAYEDAVRRLLAELAARGRTAARIPEGASCEEALAGALTLPLDVVRNEEELGRAFERVVIDTGTGLTGAALLLGLAALGRRPTVELVVVAGTEASFETALGRFREALGRALGAEAPLPPYRLHRPPHGASYGAVTAEGLAFVRRFIREEGILVDPVYTGKLFQTAERLLREHPAPGPTLIVHTGGGTGLFGFEGRL